MNDHQRAERMSPNKRPSAASTTRCCSSAKRPTIADITFYDVDGDSGHDEDSVEEEEAVVPPP